MHRNSLQHIVTHPVGHLVHPLTHPLQQAAYTLKRMPLGIPLTVSLAATVAALALGNKKAHIISGAIMTGLMAAHMVQHRKAMQHQVQQLVCPQRLPLKR